MKWVYEEFGHRLRTARKNAKLTQDAVARRVGLSRTSITNIESGNQAIQLHLVYQLARVVGVAPQELLPEQAQKAGEPLISPRLLKGLEENEQEWAQRVARKGKS